MTQAYVYKWTHLPTLKYYVGSRTAKKAHINDGYICSSRTVKPMILANPIEWERTILAVGTPEEMFEFETEILTTFDCRNDKRSFNKHNNDGLRSGLPGEKNGAWGLKRPDLSQRNKDNKGKPNLKVRGPRPRQYGEKNVMANPEVQLHHQQQVLKAMSDPLVKQKHKEACKIAQSKPEVKQAISERIQKYRADSEVKKKYSEMFTGENNPSKKFILTCPNCKRTMCKGMYIRWKHGEQCKK